ncbi:hypothetical protein ILP92_00665 [Maribius pontilimi]|uniref:DUF2029 domain-containing protein n=1 Tax=Palleronia pontilimi TaxID=1964209 RepID=A0A934IE96_9RHOB|nr:hypothetical protein [Palleronia pontilimi]MBJ3761263.1 hypothetical protein [Palleronia pontilimi]
MNGANPIRMALWCAGLIALFSGLALMKGGLFADRYEGDMLHLVEIILRVADGQIPHVDFMTPIGVLAVWPIALFVEQGYGVGIAVHLGQLLVALVIAPLTVWVACSRFSGVLAMGYVLLVMVFALALVHGEAIPNISMSMHYNRWAWALAFVMLPVGLLPPLRQSATLDALALGLPMAALVLIKVTYVVALAPGLIVMLAARREYRALLGGIAVTLVALALFTAVMGFDYWAAYVGDILATSRSEIRAHPGQKLDQVLTGPLFLGGHLLALIAIVMLRRAGLHVLGLGLMAFLPGFIFITYQNFGNDPQWMLIAGLAILMSIGSLRPDPDARWDRRTILAMVSVGMLAASAPSFFNLAYSPMRHYSEDTTAFTTVFPRSDQHDDFFTDTRRVFQVNMQIAGEDAVTDFRRFADLAERPPVTMVNGEVLEECSLHNGLIAWFDTAARQLEDIGLGDDAHVLVADLLSALWMYSDHLSSLRGGAPWRYGGAPGIEDASHVLVPLCAINSKTRAAIMTSIDEAGYPLTEVARTELFILLKKGAPAVQTAANSR